MDTLTLLKTKGGLPLTKKFTPQGSESYGGSKHYSVHSASVSGLADVAALLQKLADKKDMAFIRGTLIDQDKKQHVTRDGVNFESRRQHTLALDVDSAATQHDAVFDTEAACAEWIQTYLPTCFHDVSFVYQLTSSAGIKPGLRARIWFWLKTPRSSADLKPWAQALGTNLDSCLDASLFDAVKLHYTASPIFEDVEDPFGTGRVVLCDRLTSDEVDGFDPTQYAVESMPSGAIRPRAGVLDPFLLVCRPVDKPDDLIKAYLDKATEIDAVDPDDYEDWIKIGRCLHHQFKGSDKGWEMWDAWSAESGKYIGPAETAYRWRTFDNPERRGKRPQTFATVLKLVKDYGATFDEVGLLIEKLKAASSKAEIDELLQSFNGDAIDEARVVDAAASRLVAVTGDKLQTNAVRKQLTAIKTDRANEAKHDLEDQLATLALASIVESDDHLMYFGQQFWGWFNGVWGRVDEDHIARMIYDTFKEDASEDPILEEIRSQAKKSEKTTSVLLRGALAIVKGKVGADVFADPLDLKGSTYRNRSVINCLNGELWFDLDNDGSVSFSEHQADSYLTNQINIAYSTEAQCPLWDRALRLTFSEAKDAENLVRHLEEVLGYMIQTNRSAEALWVMFHGETGSNGKSLIASVLTSLLGKAALSMPLADLDRSAHATASLVGKLALIDDDFTVGKALSDGWLKKLSEGKVLTANPKNRDTFDFMSRALTIQLTNRWPDAKTFDGGLCRRAHIIPFEYQVKPHERIPNLSERIVSEEGAGVLNRLIAGWQRVVARGQRFDLPVDCQDALSEWMDETAEVLAFISDCLEYSDNANHMLRVSTDLHKEYSYWANSHSKKPLGPRAFLAQLRDVAGTQGMTVEKLRTKGETNPFMALVNVGFKDRPRQSFVRETFGEVVPFKKESGA